MSKVDNASKVEKQYAPDFKLKVVLEYVRNPKRLKQICKTNRIIEDLLTEWHQEFLPRASQIFSGSINAPAQTESASEEICATDSPKADSQVSPDEPSWGIWTQG